MAVLQAHYPSSYGNLGGGGGGGGAPREFYSQLYPRIASPSRTTPVKISSLE